MELNDSKSEIDDMPSFEDELESFDFNDNDMMGDSDPAVPVIADGNGQEDSFKAFLDEPDQMPQMDADLSSDFEIDLNDFSHADDEVSSEVFLNDSSDISGALNEEISDNIPDFSENSDEPSNDILDEASDTPAFYDDHEEDDEPVSLSNDELDNILSDTSDDEIEVQDAPSADDIDPESAILDDDFSMPEMTLEDVEQANAVEQTDLSEFSDGADTEDSIFEDVAENDVDLMEDLGEMSDSSADEFQDDSVEDISPSDEEEIALSGSELDNILEDTDTETVIDASGEMDSEDSLLSDEFDKDFFGDDGENFSEEPVQDVLDSDLDSLGEDEIVESSDEELSSGEEVFSGGEDFSTNFDDFSGQEDFLPESGMPSEDEEISSGEDFSAGPSILEEDDEGPIALTPEELGNIESDVDTTSQETAAIPVDDSAEEASDTVSQPSIFDEEDEGPIAFDESEMASILENVTEEEASEAVLPSEASADMPYSVDLDELETESAPAETPSSEAVDVKKEDLKKMMGYLDSLFGELPDDSVREFSNSEYFELYKKIMDELDLN
ncbi:MAG: hypothetical protein OEZ34_10200 [Spirochaetia bacterium]|nr:hypothetical protein [Spirochaetia bacterium]